MKAEDTGHPSDDGATGTPSKLLDRRSLFLAGGASLAAAALSGGDAKAHAPENPDAELPEVVGHITRHVSHDVAEVADDAGKPVRIELAPGARVERGGRPAELRDFRGNDWLLAVGEAAPEGGTFTATRVIPAVMGEKPPASR